MKKHLIPRVCACGCLRMTSGIFSSGKYPDFIKGHHVRRGSAIWNWKGNKVSYNALHSWVERKLGKPEACSICKRTNQKKYEWANISKKYERNLSDWMRMCVSCHHKYDETGRKTWEKRRKHKLEGISL